MADASISEQVRDYLKEGHDKDAISEHLASKGLDESEIADALKDNSHAKSMGKHPMLHAGILAGIVLGIIVIISLFIFFGFRGSVVATPSVMGFIDEVEGAALSGDGEKYFSLLSPELRNAACERWQATGEVFGPDGSTCLQAMGILYTGELRKFFGDSPKGLSLVSTREAGEIILVGVRAGDGKEFTLYLEETGGATYLASDFLLDAAFKEVG